MKPALLFSAISLAAALLTGRAAELTFTVTNAPVIDFSGTYETNDGTTSITIDLSVSPAGRITAPLQATYTSGNVSITSTGTLGGHIVSSARNTVLALNGNTILHGTVGSQNIQGTHGIRVGASYRPDERTFAGRQTWQICIVGQQCRTQTQPFDVPLPENVPTTGDWTLSLDIADAGDGTIAGTALVTLSSGRTATFDVTGKVSPQGTAKLRLAGTGDAEGANLKVTLDSENAMQSVKGKLFGAKVNVK